MTTAPTYTVVGSLEELERRLSAGLTAEWRALAAQDPHATVYQDAPWCVLWYRAYRGRAEPRLVLGRRGGALVSVAPLALDRDSRRLLWAGGNMADYRDVVATPDAREGAVLEVLRHFRAGGYRGHFQWGHTQPASPSVGHIRDLASAAGVDALLFSHSCYRASFNRPGTAAAFLKKESVRRHLAALRRRGEVECLRIQDAEGWAAHRRRFFEHHALRQLIVDRRVSFFDPAKQALYDGLFAEHPELIALHVLTVGGEPLAEHVGPVWRGTAYLGAPAFDVVERRRSPGQILLAMMCADWEGAGLRELDLTIGETSYKERFSTERVELPSAHVYRAGLRSRAAALKRTGIAAAKRQVTRFGGPARWEQLRAYIVGLRRGRAAERQTAAVSRVVRDIAGISAGEPPPYIRRFSSRQASPSEAPLEVQPFSLRWNDAAPVLRWPASDHERGDLLRAVVAELERGAAWLVLERDGQPCGWALTRPAPPADGDVPALYVYGGASLCETNATAVASALVTAACDEAARRGLAEVRAVSYVPPHWCASVGS